MRINVVLAIDERMDDVRDCVESIRRVYGSQAPIALATYGGAGIGPQPVVAAYAAEQGFMYLDIPRHDFLTEDDTREWHACETLARIQITKKLLDMGYSEIYIMHADVRILGDFRRDFKWPWGKWSFVAIMVRTRENFGELCRRGSWALYFERNPARLADILVRYNTAFVARVYAKYGDDKGLWEGWLSRFTLWGDLAQFDVARETEGFTGRCIVEENDSGVMCHGTVAHRPRQAVPVCLPERVRAGLDMDGVARNFERRTCPISRS
jgi:hypothetical protein